MSDVMLKIRKLRWQMKCRRRFHTPCKKPAVAIIARDMTPKGTAEAVLGLYRGYKAEGQRAYVVMAQWQIDDVKEHLDASEDVFVYDNNFNNLMQFLWRRDVRTLHYYACDFNKASFARMGFKVIESTAAQYPHTR